MVDLTARSLVYGRAAPELKPTVLLSVMCAWRVAAAGGCCAAGAGRRAWLWLHVGLQLLGSAGALAGFTIAVTTFGAGAGAAGVPLWHKRAGYTVMASLVAQVTVPGVVCRVCVCVSGGSWRWGGRLGEGR